jgi:hypothetical protein
VAEYPDFKTPNRPPPANNQEIADIIQQLIDSEQLTGDFSVMAEEDNSDTFLAAPQDTPQEQLDLILKAIFDFESGTGQPLNRPIP